MQNIDEKELSVMKGFVSKLEKQAQSITISSADEHKKAIDLVAVLKETGSKIKNKKESITKPINEALKNIRSMFKPIEDQFESAEEIIKTKLIDYTRKVNEEARKKEQAIANRVEKGTLKVETAERKMGEIEKVEKTTKGEKGEVQIRMIKKVRIEDETKIPREYLVPDMVKIRKDALGGKEIAGIVVYEEESLAVDSL